MSYRIISSATSVLDRSVISVQIDYRQLKDHAKRSLCVFLYRMNHAIKLDSACVLSDYIGY